MSKAPVGCQGLRRDLGDWIRHRDPADFNSRSHEVIKVNAQGSAPGPACPRPSRTAENFHNAQTEHLSVLQFKKQKSRFGGSLRIY